MERLTCWHDRWIALQIFIVELLRIAVLRVLFFIYICLLALFIFPFWAGSIATFMVITIPISYVVFALPALFFGVVLALFMMLFREKVILKKRFYVIFGTLLAPCITALCFYLMKPTALEEMVNLLFKTLQFDLSDSQAHVALFLGGMIWFAYIFLLLFIFIAGCAVTIAVQHKILLKLLAPPKSVSTMLEIRLSMK